ncbi:hypothetical protein BC628DRAFT_1507350 [Trametes gibbosa]|nr:hypothetical protein BC628DRAFT_1507350 [Trametes gibbosa]
MHLVELNPDLLLVIAEFLSLKDVAQLTRTCRLLYDTLIHMLLTIRPVYLDRASVIPFCQFMQIGRRPEERTRDLTPFLKRISLRLSPVNNSISTFEATQVFNDIVRHCAQHLVSISIHHVSEGYRPEELRFTFSVPLPCLQEVHLYDVRDDYQYALVDVGPQLHLIELYGSTYYTWIENPGPVLDPVPILSRHRSTVTILKLWNVLLTADHGDPFPAVRKLVLANFSVKDNETAWSPLLIRLFPNVEHIYLWTIRTRDVSSLPDSLDLRDPSTRSIADGLRYRAKAWQAEHGTWKNGLRYLHVDSAITLYCLGLSCHVSRVDLHRGSCSLAVDTMALADCRPRCVQFEITSDSDSDLSKTDGKNMPALMHAIARTPSVVNLIWDFGNHGRCYPDLQNILVDIVDPLLRATAVSHVVLRLTDIRDQYRFFGRPLWDATSTPRADDESLELPEVLDILRRDNTKLQRVFIHYSYDAVRAWEERDGGTGPKTHWKELDSGRVREIMKAEGLADHSR